MTDKTMVTKSAKNFDWQDLPYRIQAGWNNQGKVLAALPGLPILVTVVFLLTLAAAGYVLHDAKGVFSKLRGATGQTTTAYQLVKTPLTSAEYQATLDWFKRVQPDVKSDLDKAGTGITISIGSIDQHAEWLFALAAIHSKDQGVVWEAETFCVGKCAAGGAATATVKGYRQSIQEKKSSASTK